MNTIKKASTGSQSIHKAMQVLRILACGQYDGMRLIDIVRMTGLNQPTVHRTLKALINEGIVDQDLTTRRYLIGEEISILSLARAKKIGLDATINPYLNELARQTGNTVFLSVRNRLDSICISRVTGHHPIQVLSIDIGVRRPLGVGVSGIALLSSLTEKEVNSIIEQNKQRFNVLTEDVNLIKKRILDARRLGYSYAPQGLMRGTSSVSMTFNNFSGAALGAITISTMAPRLEGEQLERTISLMREQIDLIAKQHSLD